MFVPGFCSEAGWGAFWWVSATSGSLGGNAACCERDQPGLFFGRVIIFVGAGVGAVDGAVGAVGSISPTLTTALF